MFDEIRTACARVASEARFVRLIGDQNELTAYARAIDLEMLRQPVYDTVHHYSLRDGGADSVAAYILLLDTVNFGSGYFPHLQKRAGMSGYFTVASHLRDFVLADGVPSPDALVALSAQDCGTIFGQDLTDPVRAELMALFAQALNDLGRFLTERFSGSYTALIEAAEHSAERMADMLGAMPFFRDVSEYRGYRAPLYKRAQITASDLALAFGGKAYGRFDDLDKLTIFADNLVPHVLRVDGLLDYDERLLERLNKGELLAPGSPEEVEIRAVALHAVERMVELLRQDGVEVCAQQLDVMLWNRGQHPRYKEVARHRCRTVFY